MSTVYLLGFFNIGKELGLAVALIYLFIEYLVIITFYFILSLTQKGYLKKINY
tara:strand:+ start:1306 stop:1464 length:159 start_codon:yes stop_codon:yes gene_type:complete